MNHNLALLPTDHHFGFADNLGRHHGASQEDAAFHAAQDTSSPSAASCYMVTPERNAEITEENCWQQLANVLGDSALLDRWRSEQVTSPSQLYPATEFAKNNVSVSCNVIFQKKFASLYL